MANNFGKDPELCGQKIVEMLAAIHPGARLETIKRAGVSWQMVVVCPDPGDQFCPNPLDPSEMSEREWWQRDNLLLGFSMDPSQALWQARRGILHHSQVTVWCDRLHSKFIFLPRSTRRGPTGIPDSLKTYGQDFLVGFDLPS